MQSLQSLIDEWQSFKGKPVTAEVIERMYAVRAAIIAKNKPVPLDLHTYKWVEVKTTQINHRLEI